MRLTRRLLAVALGTTLMSTALSPVAAHSAGPSILDCPTPSWVALAQSNAAGEVRHDNQIDSRSPGGTVLINISDSAWRYVSHFGDVKPRTSAEFQYYNDNNDYVRRHQTFEARKNGVIHQEPEVRDLPWGPGTILTVYAFWTDECNGQRQSTFLGYVQIEL